MIPRVIIHNAVSVDGRIDNFDVDMGLYYELAKTWKEDATLVGSITYLKQRSNRKYPRRMKACLISLKWTLRISELA